MVREDVKLLVENEHAAGAARMPHREEEPVTIADIERFEAGRLPFAPGEIGRQVHRLLKEGKVTRKKRGLKIAVGEEEKRAQRRSEAACDSSCNHILTIVRLRLSGQAVDTGRILGPAGPFSGHATPAQQDWGGVSEVRGIPDSLQEAAVIDGASYLLVFREIIPPVAAPVTATMLTGTSSSS